MINILLLEIQLIFYYKMLYFLCILEDTLLHLDLSSQIKVKPNRPNYNRVVYSIMYHQTINYSFSISLLF